MSKNGLCSSSMRSSIVTVPSWLKSIRQAIESSWVGVRVGDGEGVIVTGGDDSGVRVDVLVAVNAVSAAEGERITSSDGRIVGLSVIVAIFVPVRVLAAVVVSDVAANVAVGGNSIAVGEGEMVAVGVNVAVGRSVAVGDGEVVNVEVNVVVSVNVGVIEGVAPDSC
jgi:hypothetical protein